ncbi:hypothetical protein D3C80_1814540 [compost metagenome]
MNHCKAIPAGRVLVTRLLILAVVSGHIIVSVVLLNVGAPPDVGQTADILCTNPPCPQVVSVKLYTGVSGSKSIAACNIPVV